MAKKKTHEKKVTTESVQESSQLSDQERIKKVGQQIHEILAAAGMGMEATIQIGIIQRPGQMSPIQPKSVEQMARDAGIILGGGEGDIPQSMIDMLKPLGDEIEPQ